MHALHFCPGLNYLDWENEICKAPTGFAAPTETATGTATAPAVAPAPPAAPPGPASAKIAAAVATAVIAAMVAAPAPTPPPLVQKEKMIFNPASLPPEVCEHYDDKVHGKLLMTKIHTPCLLYS